MPTTDDRLMDLLLRWDELWRQGRPPAAEELCPDDLELQARLRDRIRKRERIEAMLQPSTLAEPTGEPSKPAIPTVPGYEILEVIGAGGMGVVYKARHRSLDRVVALKMILSGAAATDAERWRFRSEAEAAARLHHPNIVQVYEVGEADGRPFLALEYVPGGSLAAHLTGHGLDPRHAAELVFQLAEAVRHAHEHGVVHRDLKPANILLSGVRGQGSGVSKAGTLTPDPWLVTPKVADFGLAKRLDADRGQTQSGAILGSPSYMPPEQALGDAKAVGPAADVYALGAILYELLTGRPPFKGGTLLETLELVRTTDPVAPRHLRARLPKDVEIICLKCLQKEPGRRYATAGELADDLRRFLAGEPIAAREDGIGSQLARLIGRTELDARTHRIGVTALWLSPWALLSQVVVWIVWRNAAYYPLVALGALMGMVVVVIGCLLLTNLAVMRSIPGAQRRQHQTVWLSNLIATFLVVFVVAWTNRSDQPADLLVIIPLLVVLTGSSMLAQATIAGVMYVVGPIYFLFAIVMTLDLSLAPLECGVLMTGNLLFQGFYIRRFGANPV
jgi:eukaryotic-like serine/threonine-protein kinase